MFRAVQDQSQSAVDILNSPAASAIQDKTSFQRLLRRVTLRTSARNQFACTVARIKTGPVSAQVILSLDGECEIEAQITTHAVTDLALSPGREVMALVKAPAVFLLAGAGVKTSVSNHLDGVVSRLHQGAVNAEVVLDLPLQRARHVTAVVTR